MRISCVVGKYGVLCVVREFYNLTTGYFGNCTINSLFPEKVAVFSS